MDCLWNDVVHFSPVHPKLIRGAIDATGHAWPSEPTLWIEASPSSIGMTRENAAVYLPRPREQGDFTVEDSDFKPFSQSLLAEINELPSQTVAYYRECASTGERPFLFHLIPHVLYKGIVALTDVKVLRI